MEKGTGTVQRRTPGGFIHNRVFWGEANSKLEIQGQRGKHTALRLSGGANAVCVPP